MNCWVSMEPTIMITVGAQEISLRIGWPYVNGNLIIVIDKVPYQQLAKK